MTKSVESLKSQPNNNNSGRNNPRRLNRRTLVCNYCKKQGHLEKFCWENPESEKYRGGDNNRSHNNGSRRNADVQVKAVTTTTGSEAEPILLVTDSANLITEPVTCEGIQTDGVVDTGAVVTVITPQYLKKTPFKIHEWTGPKVLMANGSLATPLGGTHIVVKHKNCIASGEALVLEMNGIDLLIGNDFLKQFGQIRIDYNTPKPSINLGELPVGAITISQSAPKKLVSAVAREIPAFFVVNVLTHPMETGTKSLIVKPSLQLLATKALSSGNSLVTVDSGMIPVANLSSSSV